MQIGTYDTEEHWLLHWQQHQHAAFGYVYKMFHQRLYFFALRFVEASDAKDIVSEAFLELWQKRSDFSSTATISTYLFVTVRNRSLNIIRHKVVQQQKQEEIIQLLQNSNEADLFHEAITDELLKLIYAEIDKLPPRMKEIFLLSFAEGLKPAEIARRLALSVQTVSNQKLSAIRILKAALGNQTVLFALAVLFEGSKDAAP